MEHARICSMWEGTVVSIHIAPVAAAKTQSIVEVRALAGRGLEGDRYFAGTGHYSKTSSYGGREVTLIEVEVQPLEAAGHPHSPIASADAKLQGL
jgi:hypothetical protein